MARTWVTLITVLHLKMTSTEKPPPNPMGCSAQSCWAVLYFQSWHFNRIITLLNSACIFNSLRKTEKNPNIRTFLTEVINASLWQGLPLWSSYEEIKQCNSSRDDGPKGLQTGEWQIYEWTVKGQKLIWFLVWEFSTINWDSSVPSSSMPWFPKAHWYHHPAYSIQFN